MTEVKVLVKLTVRPGSTGPGDADPVEFTYAPDPANPKLSSVSPKGVIDILLVKDAVSIYFIVQTDQLTWNAVTYNVDIQSSDTKNPQRDTLWIAKNVKPTRPYPIKSNSEFDDFRYISTEKNCFAVTTANRDVADYHYGLAVTLHKVGDAPGGNGRQCRQDPEIKNGGNVGNRPNMAWVIGGVLLVAVVAYLVYRAFVPGQP